MATQDKRLLGGLFGAIVLCVGLMLGESIFARGSPTASCHAWDPGSASPNRQVPQPTHPAEGAPPSPEPFTHDAPPGQDDDDEDRDSEEEEPPEPAGLRKLTPKEINRIRYMELRGMRLTTKRPDRVTVKISRQTVEEFLADMQGHPDFRGKKAGRAFHKLTAPQKLHNFAYYKGAAYADKVRITSDPEVFVEFRRSVLPVVLRGCATPGCHVSTTEDETVRFRLFKDPKKSPATTYANFVMLNEIELGKHRLIDRARPEESMLLTCMLPAKEVRAEFRHPGGIELKPIFQSRKVAGFKQIQEWIASLKHPTENYGVQFLPKRAEPTSEPDDQAKQPNDTDKTDQQKPSSLP
ncbi:MAG: hypothetical protein JXQ75_17575 [Phycisphaerae bacterium]|nr:hypothetical protein [Phycisphaerae bacterium]